jgi:hypothetical protein
VVQIAILRCCSVDPTPILTSYLEPLTLCSLVSAQAGEQLSFYDVTRRCRMQHEVLIGYDRGDRTELNPSEKRKKLTWRADDLLVTIAEDD